MIALNFYDTLAHRAARAAAFLKFCSESLKIRQRQRQSRNDRHPFAGAALSLTGDTHRFGDGGAGRAFWTNTLANRATAVGA